MSVILVSGVVKCKNLKTLEHLLEAIRKTIGRQNVFSLTPSYLVKQHLYILDFEVKIPNEGAFSRKNQSGEKMMYIYNYIYTLGAPAYAPLNGD